MSPITPRPWPRYSGMLRLGIDLGGTKIEVAVLDVAGQFVFRERLPTPQGDYAGTLAAITRLVQQAEVAVGRVASIGMGTPGAISPRSGLIKNANSVVLNGKPLKQDIEARLNRPVAMANDANCLALSEVRDGAAAGASSVFGVILGTGVGGALVVSGELIPGHHAIAGEWGHNPLPWQNKAEYPGPLCWCGKQGCIEQWLSGPALARDYAEVTGQSMAGADIITQAQAGEAAARAALNRYIDRLARALAQVINLFDPEVIVLGGGLSNVAELYTEVPALWSQWVFSDAVETRLVAPLFGDSSGVRGAAFLQ
ncbi:MAG: ROK family protein [Halothiobacillus sp.]